MDRRILWGLGVLAAAGVTAYAGRAAARRTFRRATVSPEDEAFDELDEVVEPEPSYLEYDQRLPCVGDVQFATRTADEEGCVLPADLEPLQLQDVPFAEGADAPAWPLVTRHPRDPQVSYVDVREKWHGKWGREFGASRESKDKRTGEILARRHAGVDLFAEEGDEVVAMEPGTVVAILTFHHGAYAIYVQNDTGDVVNYGEVEKGSWWKYGVHAGSRVRRGQKIARLGKMRTDTMLHLETYDPEGDVEGLVEDIRNKRLRWERDTGAPGKLLDPTAYLLAAQKTALGA